jgi:hypothetical protein
MFVAWATFDERDAFAFAQRLLAPGESRTTPEDVNLVLRWFGTQRPPTRLIWLADDLASAADAIEIAVLELATREA